MCLWSELWLSNAPHKKTRWEGKCERGMRIGPFPPLRFQSWNSLSTNVVGTQFFKYCCNVMSDHLAVHFNNCDDLWCFSAISCPGEDWCDDSLSLVSWQHQKHGWVLLDTQLLGHPEPYQKVVFQNASGLNTLQPCMSVLNMQDWRRKGKQTSKSYVPAPETQHLGWRHSICREPEHQLV